MFYVFSYFNPTIMWFIVYNLPYCLQTYQQLQVFVHFKGFELLIIPQVSNHLVLGFQWSHLLLNAFKIFFHYQVLINGFFLHFNGCSHSILLSFNIIDCKVELDMNYFILNIYIFLNLISCSKNNIGEYFLFYAFTEFFF